MHSKITKFAFVMLIPVITIILWYADTSRFGFIPSLWLSYASQIIGILSLSFLVVNFSLSSRIRFIEKIFGGLDRSYKIHKLTGKIAFYLIIFHPIFFALRRFTGIDTILLYFVPGNNLAYNFGIGAFWLLVMLIVATITIKLPYHIWKITHRFMIVVLVFAGIHAYLNNEFGIEVYKYWLIFITVLGVLMFIYREFWYEFFGPVYFYKVKNIRQLGSITEFEFEAENKFFDFSPGQFVFMSFRNNKEISQEAHPFSISSYPASKTFKVAAKSSGDYTAKLAKVKVGDRVKVWGPHGYFSTLPHDSDQIWIAGGIGVTPFLSMLSYETQNLMPNDKKVAFFYCTKNVEEAVYKDEIISTASHAQNVSTIFHTSDDMGFVTAEQVLKLSGFEDLTNKKIYICGPPVMMFKLQKGFVAIGVKEADIIFEDFSLT